MKIKVGNFEAQFLHVISWFSVELSTCPFKASLVLLSIALITSPITQRQKVSSSAQGIIKQWSIIWKLLWASYLVPVVNALRAFLSSASESTRGWSALHIDVVICLASNEWGLSCLHISLEDMLCLATKNVWRNLPEGKDKTTFFIIVSSISSRSESKIGEKYNPASSSQIKCKIKKKQNTRLKINIILYK